MAKKSKMDTFEETRKSLLDRYGSSENAAATKEKEEESFKPSGNAGFKDFGEYPLLKSTASKTKAALRRQKTGNPAVSSEKVKVSKIIGTALEAKATTVEAAEKIQEKAESGEFSYITITDAASKQRAENIIKRKGELHESQL